MSARGEAVTSTNVRRHPSRGHTRGVFPLDEAPEEGKGAFKRSGSRDELSIKKRMPKSKRKSSVLPSSAFLDPNLGRENIASSQDEATSS